MGLLVYRKYEKQSYYFMFHHPTKEERKFLWNHVWDFAFGWNYNYKNGKDVRIYQAYDIMKELTYDKVQGKEYYQYAYRKPAVGFAGRSAAGGAMNVIGIVLSYFIVVRVAGKGGIPVGSAILYAGCLANIVQKTLDIIIGYFDLSLIALKQISTLELFDLSDEMYKGALPLEKRSDGEYHIEFKNVSFRYPGSDKWALQNFSMELNIGEKLAIVGRNGSGKTTMIKLLCRLYDPQEGKILVNGVDIRKFRHDEYLKLFSVVFQDYQLFSLMLAENVAVDKQYDEEKVKRCLADAGFGERLEELGEQGITCFLNKDYTDEGIEISGGEAQKIAIARAIYKDAPFVLFDEPTAALDPIAESEIYENFAKIIGDKTAIYISHRLSSCKFCDKIAVFKDGQLVQLGSHETLLAEQGGEYAALWNAQAKYYEYSA